MADADDSKNPSSPGTSSGPQTSIFSARSRKQLSLFFAGASFFALSTLVTRRSLVRRYKASIPKFYHPSNRPVGNVNGALEAFEALNIATINVLSISMMVSGGLLWAFDISSLEDMRKKIRGGLGIDGNGVSANDAEEELEEWLATVLARKEEKQKSKKGRGSDDKS
ncbi:hypothetical protein F5884DRAFT_756105 [Xylogone sp. PMI_703]|nr:hypothetical protein F5884DRAFT_756105 [Xylogone sp. PMI_703]